MTQEINQQLRAFLDASPSCYHAVEAVERELLAAGYTRLEEQELWTLKAGEGYFVTRGGATLAAFRLPEGEAESFVMAAAHSDSPTFKLKREKEITGAGGTLRLNIEPYGGMIQRTWLDRPLSVAGRVMVRQGDAIAARLVNLDRDLAIIPSVAIHMERDVNRGTALNAAVDLPPLFGLGEVGQLDRLLAEELGVEQADILGADLYLYPRMKAVMLGAAEELIASPRLDDLQCVFGCLKGFLAAEKSGSIPVLCVFHNEEVGSGTRQGADSTFLSDLLERIGFALNWTAEQRMARLAASFLVSADNAHAVHPAHPEYADAKERPILNGGIVVKYNAAQHYTTEALSDAVFRSVCREAEVPVQSFSNRADLAGGSTLGNISTAHVSVPAVDIGLPQLAMHSCCEVAGAEDTAHLVRAMTVYFSKTLRRTKNCVML